jgi:hypothetical protein
MLVTVLVWAYANGVTPSRRIEELCRTDVAFRLAAGGPAMAALFGQVLVLCAELGMGRVGVVALDGTKIAASAPEVPADAWSPRRRDERIAAALASLDADRAAAEEAEQAKAAEFRSRREAGQRTGAAPAGAAAELAREKLDRAVAAQQARCQGWDARNARTGLSATSPTRTRG